LWADLEESALEQAQNLANLPFAFHHVAVMPDGHSGYGMPIGGVCATVGTIVPNMVGVDIGCGMRAGETDAKVSALAPGTIDSIMRGIEEDVPVGFKHHAENQAEWSHLALECIDQSPDDYLPIVEREYEKSLTQIGTLGGGNHFIELQEDESGTLCVMLHSGSRNIGLQVAKHYNELAKTLNARWHSSVPKNHDLAFLPLDSSEGRTYLAEMNACLVFARENRARMWAAVSQVLDAHGVFLDDGFDVHHNYAALEHHFAKNVVVHRKGAVRARMGEAVIIPGSMGSASYIAEGLGSKDSFESCSHGAGRRMGRKAAQREIPAAQVHAEMEAAGIALFTPDPDGIAEECRQAYKDVDEVIAAESDLVKPLRRLRPVAVLKA
jgi:tRNA-splicing ligase RtcB